MNLIGVGFTYSLVRPQKKIMRIFGQTINKVTITYVVISIATSGILSPIITLTKTRSEAFFIVLATLDFSYRLFKIIRRSFYKFHGPVIKQSNIIKFKTFISPLFHPLEGAHVIFIPSWILSTLFIYIIRNITYLNL